MDWATRVQGTRYRVKNLDGDMEGTTGVVMSSRGHTRAKNNGLGDASTGHEVSGEEP